MLKCGTPLFYNRFANFVDLFTKLNYNQTDVPGYKYGVATEYWRFWETYDKKILVVKHTKPN